ncbi:hypothetical protein GGX14DRAFT_692466 [Mycena pura]|uniref:Uncharacterized protein n=1 Tax=Mycena pura TaxID=153505 RepID=A0AAD7E4G0_9AGAR|nr:hypothetical protein GGX14DRAFT_692466 [Mycena pura]
MGVLQVLPRWTIRRRPFLHLESVSQAVDEIGAKHVGSQPRLYLTRPRRLEALTASDAGGSPFWPSTKRDAYGYQSLADGGAHWPQVRRFRRTDRPLARRLLVVPVPSSGHSPSSTFLTRIPSSATSSVSTRRSAPSPQSTSSTAGSCAWISDTPMPRSQLPPHLPPFFYTSAVNTSAYGLPLLIVNGRALPYRLAALRETAGACPKHARMSVLDTNADALPRLRLNPP